MYIYIQIEDLVANAFVNLVEKRGVREIFYSDLDAYGAKVIEQLNKQGETRAILVVSRESQEAILENYSDMFEAFEKDGAKGIRLLDGITPMDLWMRFCTSLSYNVIKAFRNLDVQQAVGA